MCVRDQKKLHKENKKNLNLCSVLIRLSSLALSQTDPERIISQTLKETKKIFSAKLCWIFLIEDNKIGLKSLGETKSRQNLIKSQLLPKLSPEILNRTYPVTCNHIGELYKKNRVIYRFLRGRNIHKFMGVPLKKDGKLVGALNVARDWSSPSFTKEDQKYLALLGNMIVMTKLKQAEEESKQSQRFLEAIIDNIPNPVFIKDRKHRLVVLNKVVTDLTGYPRKRMLGKSEYDFFPKDQADFFWKKDEEMFRTRKVIDIPEEPITDKEGKIHYMHTKKAPLRDSSGRTTHLVGIIEDITERKRVEAKLKESEEKYKTLVETSNDMIFTVDLNGNFQFTNKAFEKNLGYSDEEIKKINGFELVHPEDLEIVKQQFAQLVEGKSVDNMEYRYKTKNGSYINILNNASPIFDSQGNTVATFGVARDITERKRAEEELIRLSNAARMSTDSIVISDLEGKIIDVNEATLKMYGTEDKEDLIGKDSIGLIAPEDGKKALEGMEEALKEGYSKSREYHVITKNGSRIPVEINSAVMKDREGKSIGFVGITRDITERKRAEEKLLESEIKFRTLVEHLPAITYTAALDESSTTLYISPQIEKILGISPAEYKTDPDFWVKHLYPDDRERVLDELSRSHESGQPFNSEYRMVTQDGRLVWFRDDATIVRDDKGNPLCLQGVMYDITERKRAEETLRESESKYRDLTEKMVDVIYTLDTKGNLTSVNEASKTVYGFDREEVIGKNFAKWIPKEKLPKAMAAFKQILRGEKVTTETVLLDKEGKLHDVEFSSTPIIKARKVVGTRGIIRDITERKRAEKALIRNERIARERARLLTDLRNLDRIDDILTRVCQAVRDSGLFERAVMTLHKPEGKIVHLGQVGLPPDVVKRARQAPPMDRKLRARITNKKFRISDSFFIPTEASVNFSKTGRHVPQKRKKSVGGDWQPGDELFVPLRDFSGKIMGFLSVDTPIDGCRPDIKKIEALEMLVEAVAARVREVKAQEALKQERDFSQSILETANSLIICLDANAKIMVFNQECERVTGYRREEVLGKRWPELFLPPDHHHFKLKSFAKWVHAHPRDRYEGPIVTKSGEIRTILWSNTAILGSTEKEIVAIAIGHDITERKQAEKALQISQERYKLSTKAANVGVWDWDMKTNEFYIDPTVKEILGYKDEEIPNDIEVWMTYVHPDDREPVMAAAQACLDGKTPEYVFEHRMVHRDGSVRWILSRGNVMQDAKGNAVRMVGTDTDITERKRAEKALQASENKYRTLLENLPQKIFLKDRNSVYVSCNESYARDLKIKSDEIAGKTDYDFFPKELAEKYRADDKRIMELGKTEDVEERYIQERQEVFVHTVKTPVKNEQGNLIGLLGIFWDITERKRAEEALQRSERKYRTLVETAQEGIGISNPEENLLFVNQAFADLLGYKKEELLGKNLKEICDEAQYVMFRKETQKRKKGGFLKYEAELLTKRGKPKYFYVSAAPLWNEDGSFMGTLAVLSDLTDIKKAREYDILLNTSRALSRTLKFDRVLKMGAEKMTQALNADRCAVLLTEDDRIDSVNSIRVYPLKKGKVLGDVLKLRITKEHFSAYKSSLQKQGYVQIFDARIDPVPELGRKILRRAKITSALIIPVLAGKKMLGVFHVGMAKKSRTFSTEEVRLALTMANQLAVALENCKLMEDLKREHSQIAEQAKALKRQTQEKDILLRVSRALSKTMDLDEVSEVGSQVVGSATGVERCAVTLATEDGNQLEIKGLFSKEQTDAHKLIGTKFLWGDIPAMTKAIKKGKPFVISDTSDIPSKGKTREYFLKVGIKSVLGAGMFFGKKLVGILSITSIKEYKTFSREEVKLVQTMANQIAVAIENARLLEVVKKHTKDLRDLSAELIKVQENERKRIARELHDEVGQMLQSMKMNLDRVKRNLSSKPQRLEGIEDWLLDTEKLLEQTIDDIRTLTFDLRPSMLDDFGLIPTLRWFVENYTRRSNIKVSLKAKDPKYRFPAEVEITLYRITQEALTNVSKHAQATEASVLVSQRNSTVILSVRDNGAGFDTSKVLSAPRGMGLLNIKERVNLLGGSFEIISRPKKGTRLNVNIPF